MLGEARTRLTKQARRDAIVAAAAELFASVGYDRVTMRQLAAAAGVTPPVLYDHFESKQDLHAALLREHAEALLRAAARPFDASSRREFMRKQIDALFEFVECHPFAWRMLFRDPPSDAVVGGAHREIMQTATAAIAEMFALTPRWEVTPELPREVVLQLLAESTKSTLNGLAGWWWDHREVSRDQLVDFALDVLFTGTERLAATTESEEDPKA